jgi:Tol biopolymer transport system component
VKLFRSIGTLGVSGVVLGSLLLGPMAHASTFPGANGKIAFSKVNKGMANIWLMDPDGGHKRELTHRGGSDQTWSADGRKIAFINAKGQLYTMDGDGSNQRRLTRVSRYSESSPVWSADGMRIAFVRQERTGQKRSAVFTVKPSGSGEVNVSGWAKDGGYRDPSWAPGSERLVYEHFGTGPGTLLIRNIRNGSVRQLTTVTAGTISHVAWSPNGKKILFNDSPNEVYTIRPDGSHRTVISDGDSYQASWSPDGSRVVFLEDPREGSISISQADGTVTQVPIQKGTYEEIGSPSWAPDGTKLLFTMAYATDMGRASDIFSLNLQAENAMVKLAGGQLSELSWQAKRSPSQ